MTQPLDHPDGRGHVDRPLHHGAAGLVLALHHLARASATATGQVLPDVGPVLSRLRDVNHARLADHRHGSASCLVGDVGMDLLPWTLQPGEALAQRLHQANSGNLHHPMREALWDHAGTVLAATFLAEACGETARDARWVARVRQLADALESALEVDPDTGTCVWVWVRVWAKDLHGRPGERMLGAGHGFTGNVQTFLHGAALLAGRGRCADLTRRSAEQGTGAVQRHGRQRAGPAQAVAAQRR